MEHLKAAPDAGPVDETSLAQKVPCSQMYLPPKCNVILGTVQVVHKLTEREGGKGHVQVSAAHHGQRAENQVEPGVVRASRKPLSTIVAPSTARGLPQSLVSELISHPLAHCQNTANVIETGKENLNANVSSQVTGGTVPTKQGQGQGQGKVDRASRWVRPHGATPQKQDMKSILERRLLEMR